MFYRSIIFAGLFCTLLATEHCHTSQEQATPQMAELVTDLSEEESFKKFLHEFCSKNTTISAEQLEKSTSIASAHNGDDFRGELFNFRDWIIISYDLNNIGNVALGLCILAGLIVYTQALDYFFPPAHLIEHHPRRR